MKILIKIIIGSILCLSYHLTKAQQFSNTDLQIVKDIQ